MSCLEMDAGNSHEIVFSMTIDEFRIIGFYLCHVILKNHSSVTGASGLLFTMADISQDDVFSFSPEDLWKLKCTDLKKLLKISMKV